MHASVDLIVTTITRFCPGFKMLMHNKYCLRGRYYSVSTYSMHILSVHVQCHVGSYMADQLIALTPAPPLSVPHNYYVTMMLLHAPADHVSRELAPSFSVCLVGLHCCGDLSTDILDIFTQRIHESIKVVIVEDKLHTRIGVNNVFCPVTAIASYYTESYQLFRPSLYCILIVTQLALNCYCVCSIIIESCVARLLLPQD